MPQNREKGHAGKGETQLQVIAISAGIGIIAVLVLLAVFAMIMSDQDIPNGMTAPLVTLSLVAGTLLAGYRCGRHLRQNGMANGALTGGLMYLALLAVSLMMPENEVGLLVVYKCLMMLVSGAVGCILAVNRRSKPKTPRKKHR